MTDIFKVKIGLSPELMNDIFEFAEKPYSLRINYQFEPEDPSDKTWHRKQKNMASNFFPNECKTII